MQTLSKIPIIIPWKEGSLRALEAMSLAATLPQLPLPTTVTLDLKSPLAPGDIAVREEKREEKKEEEGEEDEEKRKIEKNEERIRMEDRTRFERTRYREKEGYV